VKDFVEKPSSDKIDTNLGKANATMVSHVNAGQMQTIETWITQGAGP